MPQTEETYEGHSIIVENNGNGPTVTVDGNEIELEVDDHGPKTLYSHRRYDYRTFDEPVELARALIDEGKMP